MNSSLHFFSIPALTPQPAQAELNLFLQQQRVVAVEKQWVADGAASFLSLCITVVDGAGPLPASLRAPGAGPGSGAGGAGYGPGGRAGPKVDYREVLNEADFTVFATLRNQRASQALSEGVPPYALFSNEQLACMVRQRVVTAEQLRSIDGIGEARIAKYAAGFLPLLQQAFGSALSAHMSPTTSPATSPTTSPATSPTTSPATSPTTNPATNTPASGPST